MEAREKLTSTIYISAELNSQAASFERIIMKMETGDEISVLLLFFFRCVL